MKTQLSKKEKEELQKIGELYRKTVYDSSLVNLPSIIKAFGDGLQELDGDIASSIAGEVRRIHKLVSSSYHVKMRKLIDGLHKVLSENLPNDVSFTISCRQKSWESSLRKILKYYFKGQSLILSDLVALRIIIDSPRSEKEQEDLCHTISDLAIGYFKKGMCNLMAPATTVGGNALIKDYIKYPKKNGYKSIHLAFMDTDNNIFEVQIRTQLMDVNSDFGAEEEVIFDGDNEDNSLNHSGYKNDEYENVIPYIFFEVEKANRPLFRTYRRANQLIVIDKIGLLYAKPIEERAKTY